MSGSIAVPNSWLAWQSTSVTLCGAGALGSHLADNLARQDICHWRVIDRDRVEEHNAGTQVYGQSEVVAWKSRRCGPGCSAPPASRSRR